MNNPSFDHILKDIGDRLHQARHERNEKVESVANAVGKHYSVISKIEHGRYSGLTIILLAKIANYYRLDLHNIIYP